MFDMRVFFDFSEPAFMRFLGVSYIGVAFTLGAALAVSFICKQYGKRRVRMAGLFGAAAYLVVRVVQMLPQITMLSLQRYITAFDFINVLLPILCAALIIYLICVCVHALCSMKSIKVRLRGIGLVWAWLAAAGAVFSIIAALSAGTSVSTGPRIPGITAVYTHQLILGFSALAGYILLLCKRRVGLYVILLGVGLMLGAQGISALSIINSGYGLPLALATLFGAVNPLLAWLSVRSGDKRALGAVANAVK